MTKTDLIYSIQQTLNRDDIESVSRLWVDLATQQLSRVLRLPQMIVRAEIAYTNNALTLPLNWQETLYLRREIDSMLVHPTGYSSVPGMLSSSFEGTFLRIKPTPEEGDIFNLTYYSSLPALLHDSDSSWLFDIGADAYLYSALTHSAAYLQEDNRLAMWIKLRDDSINELNRQGDFGMFSGAGLMGTS